MNSENNTNEVQPVSSGAIVKATAWSFAAEFAAKILVPLTNIILARILAPEAFGVIATINLIVSFADMFATAGFQKYIVQHEFSGEQELWKSANVAFWTNLGVASFAWVLIAVFCKPLTVLVGNRGYEKALVVSALSLPLTAFSTIQEAMFQRKLDYKVLFHLRVLVSALPFAITIPLALLGLGYWALITGTLSGLAARALLLNLRSDWHPRFYYNVECLKEMFSFSSWTLGESIAMWASSYIDILIISNHLGSYYTGLYKHSQSTVTGILTIITGATTSVLFASLSRAQNNQEQFERIFYSFQQKVAVFVLPIGVGIYCFNGLITQILLGSQWTEAAEFIGIWGLCTSLVCVFGTFSREVYRAKGKPNISLCAQLLHLAFIVPVCMYGVRRGFGTLIYVRSFAYLQIILVHMIFIKFFFHMSPLKMLWTVKEPMLCSALMGAVGLYLLHTFPCGWLMQFVYIAVCSVVYFTMLCLFKSYRAELRGILNIVKSKLSR